MDKRKSLFTTGLLAVVVLLAFYPALQLTFVGDDWIFFEAAGRTSLPDYLVKYFDPQVQTAWYRPVQGVLFRLGYDVFGANAIGYHLVNVLIHLANSALLFVVVGRVLKRPRVGVLAALLYATFPIAVEGVFKTGVIDPVTALFTLLAIGFWWRHLERENHADYWLAFASFLVALFSKEIAVTLPVTLLLVDRFAVCKPASLKRLFQRYVWFVLVWIGYAPIAYLVTRRSVFVNREGYQPSLRAITNLVDYASGLVVPWGFYAPLSYACLVAAAAVLAYLVVAKRLFALIPVIAGAVLNVLPIVLFPDVSFRFLYVSLLASALVYALLVDWVWRRFAAPRRYARIGVLLAVAIVAAVGSARVSDAAAAFGEFARVTRVPFRNVRQAHPTFPPDTALIFINPPLPGTNLSGMFFWNYGPGVFASSSNDAIGRVELRKHAQAYVYYFDAQGKQYEVAVEKNPATRTRPALPVTFGVPVRLEGYELANSEVTRGQAVVLWLYWRAAGRIDRDYTLSVQLVGSDGRVLARYDKLTGNGGAPTTTWVPDQFVSDTVVLPVPADAPAGDGLRLEIGLHDPQTEERVSVIGDRGQSPQDHLTIEPLTIR